jgi:hypothetical protein
MSTEARRLPTEPFPDLVRRLSRLSVTKYYQAYTDVDWDAPASRIDPSDPGFRLGSNNPLGASEWYLGLPDAVQARLGLSWVCQTMKYGIAFESVLSRGLLAYAQQLDDGAPEYRYALHEVIEESQHSLMFQEFINRSGTTPERLSAVQQRVARRIANYATRFPELFFFCVLAGEIFIDHDNRERLGLGQSVHPLMRRIMQIHVTEEARHVHFAQRFLQERMPRVSRFRRWRLRRMVPPILRDGERLMLQPSARMIRDFSIPASVLTQAFGPGSAHRAKVREIVAPVHALLAI